MNVAGIVSWICARLDIDDRGATMVEYGLLVALIAVVVAVAATLLGTNLSTLFDNIANGLGV